jgi:hypothetical protein
LLLESNREFDSSNDCSKCPESTADVPKRHINVVPFQMPLITTTKLSKIAEALAAHTGRHRFAVRSTGVGLSRENPTPGDLAALD